MPNIESLIRWLHTKEAQDCFSLLYGKKRDGITSQIVRYGNAIQSFEEIFGREGEAFLFSTSGRTEVGGNHTDHNLGRVLAAAVDLDTIAVVRPTDTGVVRVKSEGFPQDEVSLDIREPMEAEKFTSSALIRGIASRFHELGLHIGGFDAYTTSRVLKGSGLSSSAAFEVLIVSIFNHLYNAGSVGPVLAAQVAQYAENRFFGKPCGLMDQTACSVGGFVTIDFKNPDSPVAERIDFDFAQSGCTLVICDTGGNHANLNEEYAAVSSEMKGIAHALGGSVLREFTAQIVLDNAAMLRKAVNDRAVLRALHYYGDNERVLGEVDALRRDDLHAFLKLVTESGHSSWRLLQNCYTAASAEQSVTLGLAVSESILAGQGACRVHGGGFAGTIQAFVPDELLLQYLERMRLLFGPQSCHELMIRPVGSIRLPV